VIGSIVKAILEWLTGLFKSEIKADTKAGDSPDVPAHLRERFDDRVRKHPGAFREIPGKERSDPSGSGREG